MKQGKGKPVLPFYAVAAGWIAWAWFLPLYRPAHFIFLAVLSLGGFALLSALCQDGTAPAVKNEPVKTEAPKKAESTGNAALDKMIKDGNLALSELKRLDGNIADPGISSDIVRLEQISGKIFEEVRRDPKKLPQIQRFMDYYLPTTLKLLNAYDRASATGISGENVDATKAKVEGMMRTIVAAFEKQLDALYGSEALDISTDITVLETMMAREGLAGERLKADKPPSGDSGIQLEL